MTPTRTSDQTPFRRPGHLKQILGTGLATCILSSGLYAGAFDLFVCESFETDGEGSRYRSNAHTDGGGDFWERHNFAVQNPHPGHGFSINAGIDGSWAWAGEDVDADSPPSGPLGYVRLDDVDVSGKGNLRVSIAAGFSQQTTIYEVGDFLRIEAAFDGSSGGIGVTPGQLSSTGSYTTVGQFIGNGTGSLFRDDNLNGIIDGGENTPLPANQLGNFTFNVSGVGGLPGSGSDLSIQVVVNANGGNEEIVFDNICIIGDNAVTAPPVLANIEGTTIAYTEEDPAVQVTNTLTVSDADSANLTGATVTITGGVPSEDVLNAVPSGGVLVSGTGTNSLSLSGSATLAAYQTVLRSVTYVNSNTTNPSMSLRSVNFQVNDGANPSNGQSRAISVDATLPGPLPVPHLEELTTDGNGERYLANTFTNASVPVSDYFERTDSNPHPGHEAGGTYVFNAPQAGGYWASEDAASGSNPLGASAPGIFRIAPLDVAGLGNLQVSAFLADHFSSGFAFEAGDYIEIQVAFDGLGGGEDLLGGTYTTIGRFVGDGTNLRQDTNLDGLSTDPADAASPTLSGVFTDHTFAIPGTGNVLSVQIVVETTGNEEVAFDHINVTGDMVGDPPVLANIEGATLGFTEGDAATQITNTITATDSDSANLEGATIQLTVGYQDGQDVLAVNGALPAGISEVAFVPATGLLELTGSAPVADYQAALRQITYENTSANPVVCDRTVVFQVSDLTSSSTIESRTILPAGLVASATIPHLEDFDTDGDGVRYTSNSFTNSAVPPSDYFERTDDNPHPGHQAAFTFSAPQGGGYFAAEDVESLSNKLGTVGIVRLPNLDSTDKKDFQVSIYLAELLPLQDLSDKIEIQAAFDGNGGGTDLGAGTYTTVGRFVGFASNMGLRQDTNLDGSSSDVADIASPVLNSTMTKYTFDIAGLGDALSVQVKVTQNAGNEEFAFDHIEVTGTDITPPEADLNDPVDTGSIVRSTLNTRGYIDVLFSDPEDGLDVASITDAGAEFTLSGAAAAGVVVNGAGVAQGGDVYRYSFTGSFDVGAVTVNFTADSFENGEGEGNDADSEGFTVDNSPPDLVDDSIERYPTQSAKVLISELLSDDSDPEMNGPLTLTGVTYTGSNGGAVSFAGDWVFFTPGAGYQGDDTFSYTAEDTLGASSTANVDVLIIVDNSFSQNLTVNPPSGPDGDVALDVVGIVGRTYTVQKLDTTDGGIWQNLGTVLMDGLGQGSFVDPGPLPPTRLYRIVFP